MSRHILVIEPDADYAEKYPDADPERKYGIRCPEGNGCSGWIECRDPHEVSGVSAAEGPYADCPGTHEPGEADGGPGSLHHPWCDEDEFEFHGEVHTWRDGYGWTAPFKGCIVQWADWDTGEFSHLPVGEYEVEDDWDDELVHLELVKGEPTP